LDLSLTIYSTDRTMHTKSAWLAIRTNPLSRLSYLGASIKQKLKAELIRDEFIWKYLS